MAAERRSLSTSSEEHRRLLAAFVGALGGEQQPLVDLLAEDVVLIGDEASVQAQVRRLADAGTTELVGVPFGTVEENARTLQLLGRLATSGVAPSGLE